MIKLNTTEMKLKLRANVPCYAYWFESWIIKVREISYERTHSKEDFLPCYQRNVLKSLHTSDGQVGGLARHGLGVELAHVGAAVLGLDVTAVQLPGLTDVPMRLMRAMGG